jgi:hypothetical protein
LKRTVPAIEGFHFIRRQNSGCDQVVELRACAVVAEVKISPDGFAFVPGVKKRVHEIEPGQGADPKDDQPGGVFLSAPGPWRIEERFLRWPISDSISS